MEEEKSKIVKIELEGIDKNLFSKLRSKLVEMVDKVMDSAIDYETGSTIKEEVKKFTSLGINYAESKLKKASIENHKLIAEIEKEYSIAEKNKAEARKENAIAETVEFNQSLRKLTFTLKMTKALIIGEKGEEAIVFTQQIDAFLSVLEELSVDKNLLE